MGSMDLISELRQLNAPAWICKAYSYNCHNEVLEFAVPRSGHGGMSLECERFPGISPSASLSVMRVTEHL